MSPVSDEPELYPMLFRPALKDYIWGGRNLETQLGRVLPEGIVAESWEIAAHEDGEAIVINGRFAGLPLSAVHRLLGLDLIGRNNEWAQARGKFPLLVKLLDAQEKLSVQVHPDDEYAQAHEGNELGKTEMWVVLNAEPDAELILGVRRGTTPARFRQAIADGTLEQHLHTVAIRQGDAICVPSGTVHAILGGSLIAEIQQNSNTTYRVYDWNRAQHGVARTLHIDKALDVINFERVEPTLQPAQFVAEADGVRRERLCANRYFTTERVEFETGSIFQGECDGRTLEIWGAITGQVVINPVELNAVQFTLLPAALGPFSVRATGPAVCLRTYVES